MGLIRLLMGAFVVLVWWAAFGVHASQLAQATQSTQPYTVLQQAQMKGLDVEKKVSLPHKLAVQDFEPKGSWISYSMLLDLAVLPEKPLGIYVPKMALSGKVFVNGQLFDACGRGLPEEVRCLHRPYLFTVPPLFWHLGTNEIRFEIFANELQINGLSAISVGDAEVLDSLFYQWRYWLQVDLMAGLSWLSGLLGVMALVVAAVLRKESVYWWFGLTSVVNAIATASGFIDRSLFDADVYSWVVFASRFASGHLLILMFASFFEKLTPPIYRGVLAYTLVSLVLFAMSDNNRTFLTVLYLPLLVAVIGMPFLMFYWTWKTRHTRHLFASAMMALITVASSYDWLRFTGESSFVGMYFIPYSYSGVLFMFGGLLLTLLSLALIGSQNQSTELELRVAERTIELNVLHEKLLNSEIERSRTQERQQMLQDMHDGFGSQLVIAKMMVEQNQMSQTSLARLLEESIGDLYLLVDTLGNSDNYLPNALVDFRYRTMQRLSGTLIHLHWNVQVDHAPEVSPKIVLHILRLVQEALNNALKHAKAANIHLDFAYDEANKRLNVSVADDGIGISGPTMQGRGHKNMLARARAAGGELHISPNQLSSSSGTSGTLVQLVLVLSP